MNFKRILVAVDDTSIAAHAADVGIGLAKLLGVDLAFFHAIDTATQGSGEGIPADELAKMAERDGRELLDAFRQRAGTTPQALGFLEFGKPATKILEGAKNWSADIIVIGSHGRGRVGSLLLGSVAEGVLRHASCPVLIVRAANS
ncbi:MAG TPA: universal stress protein [Acidobacteriaceae bacterium]|nr:universal stress protein [Acidobacteriaceae bacterium]